MSLRSQRERSEEPSAIPADAPAADRELVQRQLNQIPLDWYPKEIRFDDGQVLKGPQ